MLRFSTCPHALLEVIREKIACFKDLKEDLAPSIQRFLDFVLSAEGDRILRASGAVPLW